MYNKETSEVDVWPEPCSVWLQRLGDAVINFTCLLSLWIIRMSRFGKGSAPELPNKYRTRTTVMTWNTKNTYVKKCFHLVIGMIIFFAWSKRHFVISFLSCLYYIFGTNAGNNKQHKDSYLNYFMGHNPREMFFKFSFAIYLKIFFKTLLMILFRLCKNKFCVVKCKENSWWPS